ncbi:multiple cyclophane-containing RiPP AmcA [Micromonospora sp. NPDC047762]|uniref:multiple cyclophane-containing RiPP AmcA n=1 Tax=Micromonospora sp. NPDC047762 TaxID=3364255 RepID=UPI00371EDF0E
MTVYISRHASAGATGAPGPAARPVVPPTDRMTTFRGDPPLLTFVWQRVLSPPAQRGGRR